MTQQLTLALGTENTNHEFMLWYEKSKASPEQAIKNASQYYFQKYERQPHRVVLPPSWQGKGGHLIATEPLEESLGLVVETAKTLLPKHVAVYPGEEEEKH